MKKIVGDIKLMISSINSHKVSMQQKLMLYFILSIIVIAAILFAVYTAFSMFDFSQDKLYGELEHYLNNTSDKVLRDFDTLTARGIDLSRQINREISDYIVSENISFEQLNDNVDKIEKLQLKIFDNLYNILNYTECSGAYVILNTTVNTNVAANGNYRSGIYLRRQSSGALNPMIPNMAIYHGSKAVSRANSIELHGRWSLEFKTDNFPRYQELLEQHDKIEECYYWTDTIQLPNTWENVMLLCVPIVGSQGEHYGICGLELSQIYFMKYYPPVKSEYGRLPIVLMPVNGTTIDSEHGMSSSEAIFTNSQIVTVGRNNFIEYNDSLKNYLGVQKVVNLSAKKWKQSRIVAILMQMASYKYYENTRLILISIIVVILLVLWIYLSFYMSKRFVRPITDSIKALNTGETEKLNNNGLTGHYEIDQLIIMLKNSNSKTTIDNEELFGNVKGIFDEFIENVKTLTEAEYGIYSFYVKGYQIADIPEKAFISINTVRAHNRKIYEKLHVSSRDEIMLYIDLLRRCGRLEETFR